MFKAIALLTLMAGSAMAGMTTEVKHLKEAPPMPERLRKLLESSEKLGAKNPGTRGQRNRDLQININTLYTHTMYPLAFDIVMDDDQCDTSGTSVGQDWDDNCLVDVVTLGPITIRARCQENLNFSDLFLKKQGDEVALQITIDAAAGEEYLIFGQTSGDIGLDGNQRKQRKLPKLPDNIDDFQFSGGTSGARYTTDLWQVHDIDEQGDNDPDVGAVWISDGLNSWYVGVDGDSCIGIGHQNPVGDSFLAGAEMNCMIACVLNLFATTTGSIIDGNGVVLNP